LTNYLSLGILQWLFGYRPAFFYSFAILLHTLNVLLLWKLLKQTTGSPRIAALAAIIFAVMQHPQEAVMWLAAMAYEFGGLCSLATLLLWSRGRYATSALFYLIGLFSTESALTILLLLPLMEFCTTRKVSFRWQHCYLAVPTIIFTAVFLETFSANTMVTLGFYSFGLHAFPVLGVSLHKLMFPWLYLVVLILAISRRCRLPRELVPGLLWMAFTLLPFIFLTYQNHVPSRQLYVPSMGFAWTLAVMTAGLENARLRHALMMAFLGINIAYIWVVKDAQFERRAAPTTLLLQQLGRRQPGCLAITGFPLNPWIAKMTARMAAGWQPEMISVDGTGEDGRDCAHLQWDPKREIYDDNRERSPRSYLLEEFSGELLEGAAVRGDK